MPIPVLAHMSDEQMVDCSSWCFGHRQVVHMSSCEMLLLKLNDSMLQQEC